MHMRCVCLLLLQGAVFTWAGLTRKSISTSNWFTLIFKQSFVYYDNACFTEDFNQVIYLGFDLHNGDRLYDDSLHNNNATLMSGYALLDKVPGSCGMCAKICCGGNIAIDGLNFVGEMPDIYIYKIIKILLALSLVDRCV